VYQTANSKGTQVELISYVEISTGFAEACQSWKALQTDDGEESSPPCLPAAASGFQSCVACAGFIPRDCPFASNIVGWAGLPRKKAASIWGKTK